MGNIVIRGTYHVKGREPDGDLVAFIADNAALWDHFDWSDPKKKPKPGKNKPLQLRIEAIDALETHYEGYTQPRAIAKSATHQLLTAFGVEALTYSLNFKKIITANDGAPGIIISKGLDGFDRPVSFALLGEHDIVDGTVLDALTPELVAATINYKLAAEGQVYPTFYQGMDEVALDTISRAVADAVNDKRGIWTFDRSPGFTFWEPRTIYEDVVILPKLFRRLVGYCDTHDNFNELGAWLKRARDPFTVISTGQYFTRLGDLVAVKGRDISLKFDPLDVLFGPKKQVTPVV